MLGTVLGMLADLVVGVIAGAVVLGVVKLIGKRKPRRTAKTDPFPGSLSTVTSPPIMRASCRVIARPRPVPPNCRAVVASAWVKVVNSLAHRRLVHADAGVGYGD